MDYQLLVPVKKVTGEVIENVTIKESFIGRDIKAIGNCKGEGDAMIALVANATGLSENQVLTWIPVMFARLGKSQSLFCQVARARF